MKNKTPKLPELDASALRDHGTDERVDRIWQRLESDLTTEPARPRGVIWWAPAALVIVFGSGVFVGARWFRAEPPLPSMAAERPAYGDEPVRAPETPATPTPNVPENDPPSVGETLAPTPRRAPMSDEPVSSPVELEQTAPPTASLPPAGPPDWQRLAQQGEYAAARRALDHAGGFDVALARAPAEQLMSLVDVARATGQRARALQALRQVVDRFPADPNAPLAAWTLGNMLERGGDRAGAAKAYAAYRALSPTGDFAEDALARQVEAAVEQSNLELAKKLSEQYEKDFPNGRRLHELRAAVAKLAGTEAPVSAGDAGVSPAEEDKPSSESQDESPGAAPSR